MEIVSHFFKRTVPTFFETLPIPESFVGFADLNVREWFELLVFTGGVSLISYSLYNVAIAKLQKRSCAENCKINFTVKQDVEKVVDFVDIEDITQDKVSYCRCWKSKKFPFCDGSHNAHNKDNDDNVGPLVVRHKATQ